MLGWSFYLACSWTWCIGMFLPVLLVRDYGPWGWVVFAVPNILGATAMAYILEKPEASKDIVEKHKIALIVFSIVTIMFQIYFTGWISAIIPKDFILIITIILFLAYVFYLSKTTDNKSLLFSAFVIWSLSLICFILILNIVPVQEIPLFKSGNVPESVNALLCLAPVCMFGFLLCPYLDLTFHKARQSNNSFNSKIIFTLGFCFLFLLMILFTFFYASPMENIIKGIPYILKSQKQLPQMYIYLIVFHMFLQAGFTIIIHTRSILPTIKNYNQLLFPSIIIYLLPICFYESYAFLGLTVNEIIYRTFMAFYSLVAPAYVLLFMIPKNKKSIPLNRYNLTIWTSAILLALPFFAIALLGVGLNLEKCLFIGLAILLCSRFLVKQDATPIN